MPINEAGHARNVQLFEQLVSYVTGYGVTYNPTNPLIKKTALVSVLSDANDAMGNVTNSLANWKVADNIRENAYAGLTARVTDAVNWYDASGAEDNSIKDAKSIKRKIDGKRASAVPVPDPADPSAPPPVVHSSAQTSYTNRLENFQALVALFGGDALYVPNEAHITIAGLTTYGGTLETSNSGVIDAATPLSNDRISRNAVLYADTTGMTERATMVKKYVKALFGASSPQYKQLSALRFKREKP